MTVEIYEWQDTIGRTELGTLLNNKFRLKQHLSRMLGTNPPPNRKPPPANLQQLWIDYYAEQVTSDAMADISRYFQLQQNKGLQTTPAGLPTGYGPGVVGPPRFVIQPPPFVIHPRDIKPSNTAISAIGEGLGGWYLENQGLVPLSRPVGLPLDMLFRTANWSHEVLVQIKATQEPDIKGQMRESAIPFLQYTVNESYRLASPVCYLIGVIIREGGNFSLLSLKIELQ